MLDRPPFCHCFSTRDNRYVYDVNSNEIVKVEAGFWRTMEQLTEAHSRPSQASGRAAGQASDAWALDVIEAARARDKLFLPDRPPHEPQRVREADIRADCEHGLRHLMLGLTFECNMRCTYCVHSDQYPQYPAYAEGAMTWDTARKALDYFIPRAKPPDDSCGPHGKAAAISFYGAEPLLEFGMVRQCVAHVESMAPGRFAFGMTTNGTLLHTHVADFVAEHNFLLQVSVDGPQHVHDARRRFADGGGTLQTILKNLRYLRETYPSYYSTQVSFSMVHDRQNVSAVADFLAASDLTPSQVRVSVQMRVPHSQPETGATSGREVDPAGAYSRLLTISKMKRLSDFTPSEMVGTALWTMHRTLDRLYRRPLRQPRQPEDWLHAGPCVPGVERLYVTPDGTLCPCHQTPPRSEFVIGTVDQGIDLTSACRVMNEFYGLTASNCRDCWAVRLCSMCPAGIWLEAWTDQRAMDAQCSAHRSHLHEALVLLCEILERNPTALDPPAQGDST